MGNRIRYNKPTSSGLKVSTKSYVTASGDSVKLCINETTGSFAIVDAVTSLPLKEESLVSTNTNVLKNAARRALASLGVELETETRNRNN